MSEKKQMDMDKDCYCHTCKQPFHYLGIARHRAMHRDKKHNCVISYTDGRKYKYEYQGKGGE